MKPLYVIDPDGKIEERQHNWLPDSRELEEQFFQGNWSEHVVVLWQDKRAHAFVDESGAKKQLPINLKATAIYQNNVRTQQGFGAYPSLEADPGPYVLIDIPFIYGRMILWPHSAPGWEPTGSPWREHPRTPTCPMK